MNLKPQQPVCLSRGLWHLHRLTACFIVQSLHDHPTSAPLPSIPPFEQPPQRSTRDFSRRQESTAEESGGEEILYKPPVPRIKLEQKPSQHTPVAVENEGSLLLPP